MFSDPSRALRGVRSYRVSSWDRSGRNTDFLQLQPGQTVPLLQAEGPGKVCHFYWTTINAGRFHFRQLVLRAWWDGEPMPSIEAPLGDLFGVPHSTPVVFQSLGAVVNPGAAGVMTWGLNFYLPMPFAASARMELTYEPIPGVPADVMAFWYHIELERYCEPLSEDIGRLHAQWRRENPTTSKAGTDANSPVWNGANVGGLENYVAVQAEGCGQMVGLHLQVDNLGGQWYGEGDDMVFIDGRREDQWPPAYHGTGTEEIFGGGASPTHPYAGPYTGFHRVENPNYAGKNAMYRWYLADPIRFERSLLWTIEHGHDNNYANDYTSLVTWYQIEPHALFPALPDVVGRLPRFPEVTLQAEAARASARLALDRLQQDGAPREAVVPLWQRFHAGCKAMLEARDSDALSEFEAILAQ